MTTLLGHLPLVDWFLGRMTPWVWYLGWFTWLGLGLLGVKGKKKANRNRRTR